MLCWIGFGFGLLGGTAFGVLVMAAMQAAAESDRQADEWQRFCDELDDNHHRR